MASRFGRNQKRKMQAQLLQAQRETLQAQRLSCEAQDKLADIMREQLLKGKIPLEVEHFLSPERRSIVMHAIFDERRSNLHYQYEMSDREMLIQRNAQERERFGLYLGRAIADRIADAYAGRSEGSSCAA